jgi:basic amino acid/polyamine antiporter, APA family
MGAAISAFGALNGWILLQGQMPLAAARDGLSPAVFGRVSRRGTPVPGMVISSALATALIALNFSATLVDQFTFIILLATLSTLIPYIFSSLADLAMLARERREGPTGPWKARTLLAMLALLYSLWAVMGSGRETVFWGLLLLLAGVPVYAVQARKAKARHTRTP